MPLLGEKDIGDEVADWKVGYSVLPISSPRTSFLLFFIFFFFPFLSSVLNDIVEILFTAFLIILVANPFKITIVNYLAYHYHHHPSLIFSFSLKKDQDSSMLGPSSKYS